jgi:hypothetical protein
LDEIQAVHEALPALIIASRDKDKIVREVAQEVLEQIDGGPSATLRDELTHLLGQRLRIPD